MREATSLYQSGIDKSARMKGDKTEAFAKRGSGVVLGADAPVTSTEA